ncbi:MAG: response regulator [Gammaproteobacteria bacterium]|nr:response regulator [Gammaproteobacteria bacterium]
MAKKTAAAQSAIFPVNESVIGGMQAASGGRLDGARPITILLVEDDPDDAGLIVRTLTGDGGDAFVVRRVASLSEGIAFAHSEDVDVVLMDLFLPDSRGIDTLKRFLEAHPEVPMVVLTDHDDEEAALESVAQGAQDYLMKDVINRAMLSRVLRYAIERFRYISEHDKIREQLQQMQKMESIGQLSGGVAHDFNNLLSVIQGNLQLLSRQREIVGNEQAARWLAAARDAVSRGADLTRRLLAFSRQQQLEKTNIDVAAQLKDMNALLQRLIGETIELDTSIEEGLPPIQSDRSQFENTILNLAINARDAMESGGVLIIKARLVDVDAEFARLAADLEPGEYVRITVSDSGIGMSADVKQRAFEPFFSTKEIGKGTGLGLSSVFGYMKQIGGHVTLDSEEGLGTTVSLYFPVSEDRLVSQQQADRFPHAEDNRGSETILVVDDNPDVLEINVEALRMLGYVVLGAEDGRRALEVLEEHPEVDLLFTDIVMPGGISGLELARRARQTNPALRVLYTSGFSDMAIQQEGYNRERDETVQKPADLDDVAAKIRRLLDTR